MWKQVKNFEGLYEVNEMGQIRSVQRNGTKRGGRIMAQSNDKNGYKLSKLRFKDKVVTAKVHRVVAEAFIPNPFHDGLIYQTGDIGRMLPNGEIEYI